MRSRYPRNYISEDHYPIKRVVVFFFIYTGEQKVLIVIHTSEKCLKNEILSYIHKRDPVEPERLDWVFLFLIFTILGIHFKSNCFLFKREI